ncbi:hypothetical protein M2282_005942 [Variovorax boronicumulans]|nr:hypothetical protein [Variovorax boronicumulans]
MSRKGNCWNNACSETLFGSLKVERLHGRCYETRREAEGKIIDCTRRWPTLARCIRQDWLSSQPRQVSSRARLQGTDSRGQVTEQVSARTLAARRGCSTCVKATSVVLKRAIYPSFQLASVDRLFDQTQRCADPYSLANAGRCERGDEQRGNADAPPQELIQQLDAVHRRHLHIAYQATCTSRHVGSKECRGRCELTCLPSERAHQTAGRGAHEWIVVDDRHEFGTGGMQRKIPAFYLVCGGACPVVARCPRILPLAGSAIICRYGRAAPTRLAAYSSKVLHDA